MAKSKSADRSGTSRSDDFTALGAAPSARLTVVIPESLDRNLKLCAIADGESKTAFVIRAIEKAIRAKRLDPYKPATISQP